jgi:hypothetical protein
MSIVGARRLVVPPEAHMKEGIQGKDGGGQHTADAANAQLTLYVGERNSRCRV